MKFYRFIGLAVVLALFISSCSNINQGPSSAQRGTYNPSGVPQNIDDALVQIEAKAPGFGGMFFKDGRLQVYMKSSDLSTQALVAQKGTVKNAVTAVMGSSFLSRPLRSNDLTSDSSLSALQVAEADVDVLAGQYAVSELVSWKSKSNSVFSLKGVVFIDMDEATNRVRVGVEKGTSEAAVRAALSAQGIPAGAVVVSETEPVTMAVTLQDRVRPVRGGLQINWDNNNNFADGSFLCTLGFNAQDPFGLANGIRSFVTNSHCSGIQGGVQSGKYYQNVFTSTNTNWIATEAVDPTYFTGGVCPVGKRCRRSDSALADYRSTGVSSTMGRIYKPTNDAGSITIATTPTGALRSFTIISETSFPVVGDILDKVGRTTGWTWGIVDATCFNTNVSGSDIHMLCQDSVNRSSGATIVAGGDSGSNVFKWPGGGQVSLYGVLWGSFSPSRFVFSAMSNIEGELGALKTF